MEIAGRRRPAASPAAAPAGLRIGADPQSPGIALQGAPPRFLVGRVEFDEALDAPTLRKVRGIGFRP
jgi:hypothetical protein